MLWKEKERRDAEEEAGQQLATPKKASSAAATTPKMMPAAAPTAVALPKASWTAEAAGLAMVPWMPEKVEVEEEVILASSAQASASSSPRLCARNVALKSIP